MNSFSAVILDFLIGAAKAAAQTNLAASTNAPTSPKPKAVVTAPAIPAQVVHSLNAISNQVAALQKQIAAIKTKRSDLEKRFELQVRAKQLNENQPDAYLRERNREQSQEIEPRLSKIAALELQAMELRKTWNIPEPKASRKR